MKRLLSIIFAAALMTIGATLTEAVEVKIGVQVVDMFDVSFPNNEVKVDYYVWCRYAQASGQDIDVASSLEFMNAKEQDLKVIVDRRGPERYQLLHVRAVIRKNWTITDYPFDEHTIRIHIQAPPDGSSWTLIPDKDGSAVDRSIKVAGWDVQPLSVSVDTKKHEGSFGVENSGLSVPRLEAAFMIRRPGGGLGLFFRSFVVLFVAVAIALLSNLIKPMELEVRSALGVGSLFAAVGSQFVFSSMLPESNLPTMFDRLHAMSYGVIFISVIITVACYRLSTREKESQAAKLDKMALILLSMGYLVGVAWLVLANISSNAQTVPV